MDRVEEVSIATKEIDFRAVGIGIGRTERIRVGTGTSNGGA